MNWAHIINNIRAWMDIPNNEDIRWVWNWTLTLALLLDDALKKQKTLACKCAFWLVEEPRHIFAPKDKFLQSLVHLSFSKFMHESSWLTSSHPYHKNRSWKLPWQLWKNGNYSSMYLEAAKVICTFVVDTIRRGDLRGFLESLLCGNVRNLLFGKNLCGCVPLFLLWHSHKYALITKESVRKL